MIYTFKQKLGADTTTNTNNNRYSPLRKLRLIQFSFVICKFVTVIQLYSLQTIHHPNINNTSNDALNNCKNNFTSK